MAREREKRASEGEEKQHVVYQVISSERVRNNSSMLQIDDHEMENI